MAHGGRIKMTEEDEAFNDIERQAKQRKESVRAAMLREEDDDIQDYKKPWIGLTNREMMDAIQMDDTPMEMGRRIEAKLKEKNT
jgi:hypothetical protein